MKIAIITDGNNTLGMGHVYQSISLAGLLLQKGLFSNDIIFMTKSKENVLNQIVESGFRVIQYPNDEAIYCDLKNKRPDRIIFDKLDVSPELAKKIKEILNIKLCILTNLTDANFFADITVLADIGSDFKNIYRKDKKTGQVQFFGPKYWILRPEFYQYKKKQKKEINSTKNILLIFGGADMSNITSAVLNTLLQIDSDFNITVVLGSAFKNNKELDQVISNNSISKSKVQILKNIKNVAETMFDNNVVFASPGLSFFEALVVGTPVVGFHQNDLQRDVYKGFLTTFDKSELYKLPAMIKNQEYIFPSDPFVQSMEIAEGFDEILNEILK